MFQPAVFPLAVGEHAALKVLNIGIVVIRREHLLDKGFCILKDILDLLVNELPLVLPNNLFSSQAEVAFQCLVQPYNLEAVIENKDPDF